MSRQNFLNNGNLNPGIHPYNISDFEEQFVKEFGNSTTRKNIYEKFKIWIKAVINEVKPRYIWLDGSFVTEKIDPNDLDLVIFYRPEDITSEDISERLMFLINASKGFSCDAYVSFCLEHIDPNIVQTYCHEYLINKTYWKGQFGFDRNEQAKGIVLIESSELSKLGGGF